jgi:hypothetical protein
MNNRNGGGFLGQFNFTGGETGYDVADYLLGAPSGYSQSGVQVLDGRSKYAGAYVQDSIRVSPELTLNVGLRWEFSQPWYDTQNKIMALVPGEQSIQYFTAPRGLVYPGDPGVPSTLASTRYNNLAPRVGLAYSPRSTDVSLYHSSSLKRRRQELRFLPLPAAGEHLGIRCSQPASVFDSIQLHDTAATHRIDGAERRVCGQRGTQAALNQRSQSGELGSMSQPARIRCDAGNAPVREFLEDSTFTRPDGSLALGTRSPFGYDFGTSYYEGDWANSDYNSLQASLERRAGNSTFLFGYTWSKAMDNGSYFNDRMNFANHALSRALSNFDVTHNFIGSYTYTIPFERAFSKAPKRLVSGWEIAGITRLSTDASCADRFVRSVPAWHGRVWSAGFFGYIAVCGQPTDGHLRITTAGFSLPPLGQFGTAPRRFFHGLGFNNWNLALHKDTAIRENMQLQIRAEFFNAFNHAQFANPNGFLAGGQFGVISAVQAPPRIGQVAAKFIF